MTATAAPVTTPPETKTTRRRLVNRVLIALLVIAVVLPPFVATSLELTKLSRLVVLVLAVLGVNLLTGYTGLISLGHGVFVGVGAFAMANFIDWGISLYLAGLLATLFTGLVGLILGLPALRIKGIYLALVTFGMALAFGPVARRLGSWTGGPSGRTVNNDAFVPPSFLRLDDRVQVWRYIVCLVVVGLWFWLVRNLITSRMGRAIRTLRDNEAAAATFGISVPYAKAGSLAISSAMAGTAGVLQAILNPYVGFSDFDAFLSLRLYAAAVIGGLGTLVGAVYGVIALIVVPALNDVFELLQSDTVVFGAGLVIMTFMAPSGVAGWFDGRGRGKSSER